MPSLPNGSAHSSDIFKETEHCTGPELQRTGRWVWKHRPKCKAVLKLSVIVNKYMVCQNLWRVGEWRAEESSFPMERHSRCFQSAVFGVHPFPLLCLYVTCYHIRRPPGRGYQRKHSKILYLCVLQRRCLFFPFSLSFFFFLILYFPPPFLVLFGLNYIFLFYFWFVLFLFHHLQPFASFTSFAYLVYLVKHFI